MAPQGPDASNSALPIDSPVVVSTPPVPSACRGERCMLDGKAGRLNNTKPIFAYPSGKMVVVRSLSDEPLLPHTPSPLPVLVYRGHHHAVTACKMSPSGAYMTSGDERGTLKVWAYDHEEHLCKYEASSILTGPIRDLDWDGESKRIVLGGERAGADAQGDCAKAIQWDTGVTVGQLSQHLKGRVASVAMKPNRPFRVVTGGKDDYTLKFHKGPPFQRIPPENGIPAEQSHSKGGVCVRYNSQGTLAVSVGTDRSICSYDGKTLEFKSKLEHIHTATIYSVAWSGDDKMVITASGDGTCKLIAVADDGSMEEKHQWKPAEAQFGKPFEKVPVGGGQLGATFVKGDIPVSVGLNGQLCVLPMPGNNSDAIKIMTGHYAPVADLAIDHANGVFYTGDTDGILCKWDVATAQPTCRLEPPEGNPDLMYIVHGGAISGVAVTGSGSLMSVGWDDKMFIADKQGKIGLNPLSLGAQPRAIETGTELGVVATVEGLLLVKDGKASSMIPLDYSAQAVCVSKDDKTVFVGGDDCKVHVYEVDGASSLTEKHVIEDGHLKPIHSFALSNNESKLAAGDARDVVVYDLKDNFKPLVAKGRWCFHTQRVTCLSWSPDDTVVASGGADDSIYLWSLEKKMKRIHYQYAHRGGITGLSFLPKAEGLQFLSVGVDSVVNKWDVTKDVQEKFA